MPQACGSVLNVRWSKSEIWFGWVLVFAGALWRIPLYWANRSLWWDEAAVALNLLRRSFGELTHPLDYAQAAPLGFLWIERVAVNTLGTSELSLRLFPLLCGLASLLLMFGYARKNMDAGAGLSALAAIVFSKAMIYYSVELKQYALDVDATIIILICAMTVLSRLQAGQPTRRAIMGFAIAGIVLPWFSHPVVFVIAGTSSALICGARGRSETRGLWFIVLAGGLGGLSACCNYYFYGRASAHNPVLMDFWQRAMMPTSGVTVALRWAVRILFASFEGLFGHSANGLAAFYFGIGCVVMVRNGRSAQLGVLLLPVASTFVAAMAHRYPFADRLILFLLPIYIVVIAAGLRGTYLAVPQRWNWIAPACLVLMLAEPAILAVKDLAHRPLKEEMRPIAAYVAARQHPGEEVYVHFRARAAWEYYAPRSGAGGLPMRMGQRGIGVDFLKWQIAPHAATTRSWIVWAVGEQDPDRDIRAAITELHGSVVDQIGARNAHAELIRW